MRGKRKAAENKKIRKRAASVDEKRAQNKHTDHEGMSEVLLGRGRRVSSPLVRSRRPGTLDLDNAKIFEVIPFP